MKPSAKQKTGMGSNWLFRVMTCLLVLVFLSFWLLSGLYAKYTTSDQTPHAARVAAFRVRASAKNSTLSMREWNLTDDHTYELTIENDSEVAVSFTVRFRFQNPLPDGITVTLNDQKPDGTDGTEYVFEQAGNLGAGAKQILRLQFEADWNQFAASQDGSEASVSCAFDADICMTQID